VVERFAPDIASNDAAVTRRYRNRPGQVTDSARCLITLVVLGEVQLRDDSKLVSVRVDPDYTFHKADRGQQQMCTFDAAAFEAGFAPRFMNPSRRFLPQSWRWRGRRK